MFVDRLVKLICDCPKLGMKGFIEMFTAFYKKYKAKIGAISDLDKLVAVIQDLAFNLDEGNKKPALELLKVLCEDKREYVRPSLAKFYSLIK